MGVFFMVVNHDADCPALHSQSSGDCVCTPVVEMVTEESFMDAMVQTRRERREAAREAEKALRKAAKK